MTPTPGSKPDLESLPGNGAEYRLSGMAPLKKRRPFGCGCFLPELSFLSRCCAFFCSRGFSIYASAFAIFKGPIRLKASGSRGCSWQHFSCRLFLPRRLPPLDFPRRPCWTNCKNDFCVPRTAFQTVPPFQGWTWPSPEIPCVFS